MRIYYAHCQAIYGSPQEVRDLETLKALGFEVLNPNSPEHIAMATTMKADGRAERVMDYFSSLVFQCDALAFRALPDGAIPAGIAKEIETAKKLKRPMVELPSCIIRRVMTVDATREYLAEVGQR